MSIQNDTPVSVFTRENISSQTFLLTEFASKVEAVVTETLKNSLGAGNQIKRYTVLRLFLARSISETRPIDIKRAKASLKEIKGEFLFGSDDFGSWVALIILEGGLTHFTTMPEFKDRVEYHLDRGAFLINDDLDKNPDILTHIKTYAKLVTTTGKTIGNPIATSKHEVIIRIGEVSQIYPSKKPLSFTLNKLGTPPHIALMGEAGRGKSTTGMQIAKQIIDQANIPLLLIDPKGEFVQNGILTGSLAKWNNSSITPIQAGEKPIPLNFLPNVGVGDTAVKNAVMRFRETIAACCKSAGDVQKERIQRVIHQVIQDNEPSLENIKESYANELRKEGSETDSVLSKLNDLTSLNIFEPKLSSQDFFSRSWVISLASVEENDLKRLITMMILDAAKTHILRQPDSEKFGNTQSLRNMIIIDEARRVMASNKSESLSELIRLGRSKGLVVMLLSQDPTDFQGESDDFLTQIGTCVAFACKSGTSGLSKLGSVYGQRLLPEQFTELTSGLAFCKWPDNPPAKIRCWGKS